MGKGTKQQETNKQIKNMEKKEHFGIILEREMNDKGYLNKKIREKLDNMNFNYFKARLTDGKFTYEEIGVLKANRYLPE